MSEMEAHGREEMHRVIGSEEIGDFVGQGTCLVSRYQGQRREYDQMYV